MDYKINNALAFRVASLDYSHSWTNDLNGVNYSNGLAVHHRSGPAHGDVVRGC